MSQICEPKAAEFSQHISQGSLFISKIEDIEREEALLPYAYYLRQAWNEFDLSGVLCVDNRPTIYLCEADRFTIEQKREKQRLVWNQGLVPLLIFITPDQVEVHSTVKKPEAKNGKNDLSSLVQDLGKITDALECARFIRSIETGQFFHERKDFFPTNETVDQCLIQNLVHTARKLKNAGWKLPQAYALLGRILFVSFLEKRKFIKPHYYPTGTACLLDILTVQTVAEKKQLLYHDFFQKLKREFNGTMFDTALAEEERRIGKTEFQILANFLNGEDMKGGQMTLDFWAYDFRFIPVETISAIYEEFMGNSDLKKKRKDGAYYTPRHLAETTLHVALENNYSRTANWRVLDASCGSGIFLVAMFNLLAEQWRRENSTSHKKTKAQALLDILQNQIRGVDVNPDACRIAAFSLYLALFEKLKPMDVDEFKENVRAEHFLPPLLWDGKGQKPENSVVMHGDFLKDKLPLENNFDLIIGNPPWKSRGKKQIALDFATHSPNFLREGGIGCLLLPSTILVNRHGTLDGDWFRTVSVEKIVQLADFRFVLFEATHPCFIMRWRKTKPTPEHVVAYETPKLNRFDRRSGVFVIEPDDQKLVPQHDVIEAALCDRLQSVWSRKFWGTPRDEAFLRRLDFYPSLSESIEKKKWGGGVGFKPYYPGASQGNPEPIKSWKLSDKYLSGGRSFPQLVVQESDFSTLKQCLEVSEHRKLKIKASLDYLHRKPTDDVFSPPMVVFSQGFTKFSFCNYKGKVRFENVLRSITGQERDANLLRFLTAVLGSRLVQYLAFHSGSSNGIGRDQLQVYESLALPFPLPDHELAVKDAEKIVNEVASIIKEFERSGKNVLPVKRTEHVKIAKEKLEVLVEAYFSVTDAERILIKDTLKLSQPSIHRKNLDGKIPSLTFPEFPDRKRYADTLCEVLNRRARKQGIHISAQGMASKAMNLVLFTVIFGDSKKLYAEAGGAAELWTALKKVNEAAQRENGNFNYLRGFSYYQHDRLYVLKPATMRNWCRTAALNDADAIFEHLNSRNA